MTNGTAIATGTVVSSRFRQALDELYSTYNGPEHIHPDPLEFVHLYDSTPDREVVGLIASSLAYGRVKQILSSVRTVLDKMGPSPSSFLLQNPPSRIRNSFRLFKHRFTSGVELSAMLIGIRKLLSRYGSLEACFLKHVDPAGESILPPLSEFVSELSVAAGQKMPMFLPSPLQGSACKRLNLFLRWMVRSDNVDPGAWKGVSASHLVVPLDTHMHRIALSLGLTSRKQADLRCAIEVTRGFASICPEDPVRYDFALTRLGMNNNELSNARLLALDKCL
ncbi:MAG: TIGR02757 family protein [Syntrophobacter sp.]